MSANAQKKEAAHNEAQTIQFAAETSKVLRLMIHSLYTNKDIFLRELLSNASDACDKLRYEAQQDESLYEQDAELKVQIAFNKKAKSITITDNGIGMNREDLIQQLGTIARSGTEEFAARLSGDAARDVALIGQFGVGFYSAFMVAHRVEVLTRKAGEARAWHWQSEGEGSFDIAPADESRPRGTSITLHLSKEAAEYADQFRLKHIAQTYSDHIAIPIELTDEEGATQRINEASAIWVRPKKDVTPEQYQAFYQHVAHSPDELFLTLHHKAEGLMEYYSLLFVPSMKPFDLFHPDRRARVKLYVRRVFITDENVQIVPSWLRFLRGVVDSQDLPLNISRETLQDNPMLGKIRDGITNKLLAELKKKADKAPEDYAAFWSNFGAVMKEGLCESQAPKEKILGLCRFHSTHGEDAAATTSLDAYLERMQEGQEAIYVLHGEDAAQLRQSPQLEGFARHSIEVLLLTDHVDDFWLNVNPSYQGKTFKSVTKAGADLDKLAENKKPDDAKAGEENATASEAQKADMEALCARMKAILGDEVRAVQTTAKLSQSPVCLAVGEGDLDLRMERFLLENKQISRAMPKILEINPEHPIITSLAAKVGQGAEDAAISDWVLLLLDQARIQEGEPISNAADFAKRMGALMVQTIN
jgi:molecular chaperone HtpG